MKTLADSESLLQFVVHLGVYQREGFKRTLDPRFVITEGYCIHERGLKGPD